MQNLTFVDACTDEHFRAMSLIHALGWRDTYVDAVPAGWKHSVKITRRKTACAACCSTGEMRRCPA